MTVFERSTPGHRGQVVRVALDTFQAISYIV